MRLLLLSLGFALISTTTLAAERLVGCTGKAELNLAIRAFVLNEFSLQDRLMGTYCFFVEEVMDRPALDKGFWIISVGGKPMTVNAGQLHVIAVNGGPRVLWTLLPEDIR